MAIKRILKINYGRNYLIFKILLPFSLLESCKYDDFPSLFNEAKKQKCDTKNERVAHDI